MDWLGSESGFTEVLQQELRFLVKFINFLRDCDAAYYEDIHLDNALDVLEDILKDVGVITEYVDIGDVEDWDPVALGFLDNFEKFVREIRTICSLPLESLRSMSCSDEEILKLVVCLVGSFQNLAILNIVPSMKIQIKVVEEKLSFLRNLLDLSEKTCNDSQVLKDFMDYVKGAMPQAVFLSLFFMLKGKDEAMAGQELETLLSDLLQKLKPSSSPKFEAMFMLFLQGSKSSRSCKFLISQVTVQIVDFLLKHSVEYPLKDNAEVLEEGLIFIISFLMDTEEEALTNTGDGLIKQVDAAINEKVDISSLYSKIVKVKTEIKRLYVPLSKSQHLNFPKTNSVVFISFLLENLKEMVKRNPNKIACTKHQLAMVLEELLSLKPFLEILLEPRKGGGNSEDLRKQVINMVVVTEHVISSCFTIDHPLWYDMLRLTNVMEEIKKIQTEVKKYTDQLHNAEMSSAVTKYSILPTRQSNPSSLKTDVMGREDEFKAIIEKLNRGTKQLDIVSIVGMAGLGKTTIANKVYNDPNITHYFSKRAWCCVSQLYKPRELYFVILTDVSGDDARKSYSHCSDNDLVEKIWKSLKQQRYLIVLDDIWSIEAWEKLRYSFPDDNKGSRIIFTSQIHDLVSQAKPNCNPYPLRWLSDEESWELLRSKIFHEPISPLDELSNIGKKIAKNCKGLPLILVLVAGILTGKDIEFWKQMESKMCSQVVSEMCKDVLELSYIHLPEYLKPCFLYFGTFPEDTVVRAKKLMSLWIAEGLIPRTHKKSSCDVAMDYLTDLISLNVVILDKKSSVGGIKACRVHDLLHDLCVNKSREDNFQCRVQNSDISQYSSSPKKFENYRLSIQADWTKFLDATPTGRFIHSLVYYGDKSVLFSFPKSFLNSFKFLNVLDLEQIGIQGPFPQVVTLMVHLRYLAILCQARGLPESIANLWNLETLILPNIEVNFPEFLWQMKSLRHVNIGELTLYDIEYREYGQLQHLEHLSNINFRKGNNWKELLRRLPGLRKLVVIIDHTDKSHKFPELSGNLTHVDSVTVLAYSTEWGGYDFSGFHFPSSVRKLTLDRLKLEWRLVSVIGQLPSLEVLKLKRNAFKGNEWDVEDGEFLNLKHLELKQLDFEDWIVQDDPFPNLKRLIVKRCEKLRGIPSSLGNIPTLEKIKMDECPQASRSAWEIFMEQQELQNDALELVIDVPYDDGEEEEEIDEGGDEEREGEEADEKTEETVSFFSTLCLRCWPVAKFIH